MLSKVYTGTLYGLQAKPVAVETDLRQGLPTLSIVGLPNTTIRESGERIKSAILNSGYKFPSNRITINLSPANTKKEGSHFDLAIAVGVLASIGIVKNPELQEYAVIGELSLDGTVNRIEGTLPLVLGICSCGIKKIILPAENIGEGNLVADGEFYPVKNLKETVEVINKSKKFILPDEKYNHEQKSGEYSLDYSDVAGQESAKRAVTICCAGAHGAFLEGPPGAGKSMIAKRIPTIMPEMTYEECLEVTKIYSITGGLSKDMPVISKRPFRAPHHTISDAALIGGGIKPKPGELSLAHLGVLFLDEITEFNKNTLEMLRQPLEEGEITVARSDRTITFPCNVMLIAAGNPCRCGYYGDSTHQCTCTQSQLNSYRNKMSGPIMDRIDLHIRVAPLSYEQLSSKDDKYKSSSEMREEVKAARKMQLERYKGDSGILFNSQLTPELIKKYCKLDQQGEILMEESFEKLSLSARAYSRVLKVSRTIADLDQTDHIQEKHVAEALMYRGMI